MLETLRTLRWSTWLGWQIESNWTDPRVFLLYLFVKPVTGSLMLVAMFYAARYAVAAGRMPPIPLEFLPFLYVSNACYGLVGTVMFGMTQVVMSDRESYRMLKYIFISPAQFQAYFAGRGLARAVEGSMGAGITIMFGLSIPDLRRGIDFGGPQTVWLLAFLPIGVVMLWSAGMLLASAALNMTRGSMFISEGIAGIVYLLSGVVFPISQLPKWTQLISMMLPTTYWLEGMRRSLLGTPPAGSRLADSPLSRWTNIELCIVLIATTVALVLTSQFWYQWNLRKAWRLGKIDEATGL